MPASASYLSRYGYEFVVSTTQASINSGLLEYFSQGNQPVTYICFLAANKKTKTPPQQISLEDLMKKTGGINPFDIPDETDYDDDRITVLTRARFVCGFKMQIGLPSGFLPKDLPPVVILGNSANNLLFRMYCSQFSLSSRTVHLMVSTLTPALGVCGINLRVKLQASRGPWKHR